MGQQKITEYVDRSAVASDTDFLIKELEQVYAQFQKVNGIKVGISGDTSGTRATAESIKTMNAELSKLSTLNAKAAREAVNYQKAQIAAKKAIQETEKATQQAIKTEIQKLKIEQDKQKAEKETQRVKAQSERDAAKEKKMLDELSNDYLQLSRAYDEAALKYKNYALVLGENNPITLQQLKTTQEMNALLSRLDQNVGNYRRNVGNYASAFSGLNTQFTQLTRELPALGVNVNTFVLAISNNLPYFIDEVGKAKVAIKEMQDAGKPAPTLFKAIAGALFSWQTALSIGVTLLTIYGGKLAEAVGGLFDTEAATLRAAEATKEYNEQLRDRAAAERELQSLLRGDSLSERSVDVRKAEQELAYANAVGKSNEEILKLEKNLARVVAIQAQDRFQETGGFTTLDRLKKEYTSLQIEIEQQQQVVDNFRELYGKGELIGSATGDIKTKLAVIDAEKARLAVVKDAYDEQKQIVDDYFKTTQDLNVANLKLEAALAKERTKILDRTFFAEPLKDYAKLLKEVSQSEDLFFDARVKYRTEAAEVEKSIIEKQREVEIYNAGIALRELERQKDASNIELQDAENEKAAAIKAINERANYELLLIEKSTAADLLQIKGSTRDKDLKEQKEYYEELIEMAREAKKAEFDELNKDFKDISDKLATVRATRLSANAARLGTNENGERDFSNSAYRKYLVDRDSIVKEYARKDIVTELQKLGEKKELLKKYGEDTIEVDKEIAEKQAELNEFGLKDYEAYINKRRELQQALLDEGINVFGALVNAGFENKLNELEEEIRLIEERKRAEIEAINATALSEEEKAARIYNVNQRAAIQREQLELRQRQVAERQARFQKALDIFQIISSTAKSIMAVYSDLTIPLTAKPALAAIAGAIGAAQIAVVLATPVPKYKEGIYGRMAHPGGKAIVNDGGKREVIVEPGQLPYLQSGVNELVDLAPGTQVYPDLETFAGMNNLATGSLAVNSNGTLELLTKRQNEITIEQNRHLKAIEAAIRSGNKNVRNNARSVSISGDNRQLTYLSNALS